MSNYNWPINPTTVNSGPVQYEVDGNPITVNIDTVTPANSTPLPVTNLTNTGIPVDFATETTLAAIDTKTPALVGGAVPVTGPLTDTQLRAAPVPISAASLPLPTGAATEATLGLVEIHTEAAAIILNEAATGVQPLSVSATALPLPAGAATEATLSAMSAKLPATLGQKSMAASMAVTIASDQSAVPVSPAAGSAGNSPGSSTVSTVATITAPANALGFILMNLDTSTTNMRYRIGGTAAVASGQQLQPGRDTGYIPCGANISIIAESGTCNYDIQWVIR